MTLTDRTISIFEERIAGLIKITDVTKLPQWNDVDVIIAACLLTEYRKLQTMVNKITTKVKEYKCKHCSYSLLLTEDELKDDHLYCPSCNMKFEGVKVSDRQLIYNRRE